MRLEMQSAPNSAFLRFSHWTTAIVGSILDDRGSAATEFAKQHSDNVHNIRYNPRLLQIEFDGRTYTSDELEEVFGQLADGSLLLETTTLRVDEILLCCKAIKQLNRSVVSLLYIEPQSYYRPRQLQVLHRRDFDLTTEFEPFSGIPGSMFMLREDRPTKAVFLLGYEGQRLKQVLDQTDIRPSDCYVVFGVPAFQPGWEMDSFANNVRVIQEREIARNVLFSGAQNPLSAFRAINRVYQSCAQDERMVIIPIGTKPHGIGAVLFACEHDDIGILYDHPNRKVGRSKQVGSWHLFNVAFG